MTRHWRVCGGSIHYRERNLHYLRHPSSVVTLRSVDAGTVLPQTTMPGALPWYLETLRVLVGCHVVSMQGSTFLTTGSRAPAAVLFHPELGRSRCGCLLFGAVVVRFNAHTS